VVLETLHQHHHHKVLVVEQEVLLFSQVHMVQVAEVALFNLVLMEFLLEQVDQVEMVLQFQ
jgi:hypothetical protein